MDLIKIREGVQQFRADNDVYPTRVRIHPESMDILTPFDTQIKMRVNEELHVIDIVKDTDVLKGDLVFEGIEVRI